MIYIASPYSDPDPAVMLDRFEKVCRFAGKQMEKQMLVYSPIAHSHSIAVRYNLPRTWEFWKNVDLHFLDRCDQLWVYCLPGWNKSKGVLAEIKYAEENNILVDYCFDEFAPNLN